MPDYRFYKIGQDGHVVGEPVVLIFDDDDSAIAFGKELRGEAAEVWEGKRLVASLRFQSDPAHLVA
jgi:hypothetical protein